MALVAARELVGREVARRFERETGHQISYGTLYTAFRRLNEAGWVTTRDDEDGDGRLRYFKLTGRGAQALAEARIRYRELGGFAQQGKGATS